MPVSGTPTSNDITTSYAGVHAGEIIGTALLSGNTIANGGLTVKPNIKYKEVLTKISIDDIVKDASCDFASTSTIVQTEQVLIPESFDVNLQVCKDSYVSDWTSAEMGFSEWDVLPKSIGDFMIARIIAKVAAKIENTIWSGDKTVDGEFDGFETLLASNAAQPAAMEIAGTTLTAGNIQAQMNLVVDQIPNALYADPELRLYIPLQAYKFYVQSLSGFGTNGAGAAGVNAQGTNQSFDMNTMVFNGVPLFVCNGMSNNTMVCTTKDNLVFGTGLLSDANLVKVLDMSPIDLSSNVRFALRYSAGVQFVFGSEIVTYGIINGAN
jgi:hypothetical protein